MVREWSYGWRSTPRRGWCRCRPSSRLTPWRRCSVACWGRRVAMIALA
jgi:hypothetical protein